MAYTPVTPVTTALAGTDVASSLAAPSGAGAGNGDAVPAGCFLLIKNGATPTTVTIKNSGALLDGSTVSDRTFTVGATTNYLIGPLSSDMKQAAAGTNNGLVLIEYSSIATVTRFFVNSPW